MPDESRNPLEFDAVVRRFAEATEVLANVREQLEVLAELRKTEEGASTSLQESAAEVARFAAESAGVLKGLEDAQTKVAEVLKVGADLLDGTELKGIAESAKANSQSISVVDRRVDALESKMTEMVGTVTTLVKGIAESAKANSQSISVVDRRVDALESNMTEMVGVVTAFQAGMEQGINGLGEEIKNVHADVKTPIIVKRLF